MQAGQLLGFGPYQLALGDGQVWRGKHAVKLTPKALVLLRTLLTRAGGVVTKEELLQVGWPQTAVSDDALRACIQELRRALGDDARQPRYIETIHRRGFRFIGKVVGRQHPAAGRKELAGIDGLGSALLPSIPETRLPTPPLVGRDGELAQLEAWFDKALGGERQLVFVTGEPGIGKTMLVHAFLTRLAGKHGHDRNLRIGRGQCIEQYGAGEAYLPLLDALGRLGREAGGQRLIELLSQQAPTWLIQLPALLNAPTLDQLQRQSQAKARQPMLRELAEVIERLTTEGPFVLWLEDLHWADVSTLEWLAYMARRRETARVLVIATYRPVEVLVREHPLRRLKQELQVHGECVELPLDFLSEEAVAEYLAMRFSKGKPSATPVQGLAHTIHSRTDGNPLFMVTVVNDLVARGILIQRQGRWELTGKVEEVAGSVPENLQQLIAQQVDRLSPEIRRMLEVGSVAGAEFSAAAVAAGMDVEVEWVEDRCEELVRQEHFLRASGTAEWPDGTVAARYAFLHALYQEVVYHRLTARQRQWLHRRIGEREEVGYGARAKEIAAELATHFEQGRDYRRAVQYLQQSGWNAVRRCAPHEAINLLTKALELLKTWPDTPKRAQQEVTLLNTLMPALMFSKGDAAPEKESVFVRKRELCEQLGWSSEPLFWTLMGLCVVHWMRAEYQTAHELAEQCLHLAQSAGGSSHQLIWAHYIIARIFFCRGEFVLARNHLEKSIALYDPQRHRSHTFRQGQNPQVAALQHVALVLWHLGYPDQALKRIHNAITLAHELSHPYTLAFVLSFATLLHQHRREQRLMQEQAEAVVAIAAEQEFPFLSAWGSLHQGWALAEQGQGEEGIAQIHQGLAALHAMRAESLRPYFLALLAEAYRKRGQAETGLSILAEALAIVHKTGERYYEAELYRLKGELTLVPSSVRRPASSVTNPHFPTASPQAQAEVCFLKAIEIARRQQAKSLELRAVTSLARLLKSEGKRSEARAMLAEIYGWFTEGFDTADLIEAKALLDTLSP